MSFHGNSFKVILKTSCRETRVFKILVFRFKLMVLES